MKHMINGDKMRYILPTLLLIFLPLYALDKENTPPPSLVVTAAVTQGVINPLQTYVGTLYYDKQSKLASEFAGVVDTLTFNEGDNVRQGEVLASLDTKVLQANIAAKTSSYKALEANLIRQKRDLKRTKTLFEKKSISESSYDQAFYTEQQLQAEADAMKNELKAMKLQLEKTHIKAPFDAVITARNIEIGEWVGKGESIATLVATDTIEARLNIPARLLDILKSHKSFHATIGDKEIEITLKSIIPIADTATRTFTAKMHVPTDMGLIEGMRIDIKVPTLKKQSSSLVPRDAVIKRFGQTVVFTVTDNTAMMIPVQVIGYKTNMAAVSGAGLQEQMRVIIKGNERIFPNMPVIEKE